MRSSTVGDNSAYGGLQQQYPGHYGNQFSKDAEDTIKNVVGVGC